MLHAQTDLLSILEIKRHPPTEATHQAAALGYAARGWPVFPCHAPQADRRCSCRRGAFCKAIGKHPRTKHGFKDATIDAATIQRWWTQWLDANIGIRTGNPSGMVVIDVDPDRGGADTLAALEQEHGALPETLEALTGGGGRHLLYQYPADVSYIPSGTDVLGPGIDLKADGGYIIAPPSLHETGEYYVWEVSHEPEDVSPAPLPPWVLERISSPSPRPSPSYMRSQEEEPNPEEEEIRLTPHASKTYIPEEKVFLLANASTDALSFPLSGPVTQADQMALLRRRDVVEGPVLRLLRSRGLPDVRIGTHFCCVVHPEAHASAAIYPPREGHRLDTYAYLDFHGKRKTWPLAVIYRSLISGKPPKQLRTPTLVTWTTRLLVDAGVLAPYPVHPPKLPVDAPAYVRPIYEGFCHLLECKWLIKPWKTPYTWQFASEWTGQSPYYVQKALKWLLASGIMIKAGMENELTCFLLGTLSRIQRGMQQLAATVQQAHTALGDTLTRFQRIKQTLVDMVQAAQEALWTRPCAQCGRTTYAPDDCPQCLMILNARLHHRAQANRARERPTESEESSG